MFLKIEGQLIDVLGEKARGNIKQDFGIEVNQVYQFLNQDPPVTIARIVDPVKAEALLNDVRVTKLDTVEAVNTEIDNLYVEKYSLKDSTALQLDLQLSGKTAADIPGYDTNLPMISQTNLQALYNAGMAGIAKSKKPPYLS